MYNKLKVYLQFRQSFLLLFGLEMFILFNLLYKFLNWLIQYPFNMINNVFHYFMVHLRKNDYLKEGLQSTQELKGVWSDFVDQEVADAIGSALVDAAEVIVHASFFRDFFDDDVVFFVVFLLLDLLQIFFAQNFETGDQGVFNVNDKCFRMPVYLLLLYLFLQPGKIRKF